MDKKDCIPVKMDFQRKNFRPAARRSIRDKSFSGSPSPDRNPVGGTEVKNPYMGTESSETDEYQSDHSDLQNRSLDYTDGDSFLHNSSDVNQFSDKTGKNFSKAYRKESYLNEKFRNPNCAQKHTSSNLLLIAGLLGSIIVAYFIGMINSESTNSTEPFKKTCRFDLLRSEFPMEKEQLWKILTVGTERILNGDSATPGVYLFLHSNSSLLQILTWKIAETAAKCFDPSLEPLNLDNKDFTFEETKGDYGVVIEKYKNKIKEGSSLVVANLNEIPGKAARALHAICDVHSPIVRKVLIFMTLVIAGEQGKPVEIAENKLFELWSSNIKRSELDALITRVTDEVFQLQSK